MTNLPDDNHEIIYQIDHFVHRNQWIPDAHKINCVVCQKRFGAMRRKHHCRRCGDIICNNCSSFKPAKLPGIGKINVRICKLCILYDIENKKKEINHSNPILLKNPEILNYSKEITDIDTSIYHRDTEFLATSPRNSNETTTSSDNNNNNNNNNNEISLQEVRSPSSSNASTLSNTSTSTISPLKNRFSNNQENNGLNPNENVINTVDDGMQNFLIEMIKKTTETQQQLANQQNLMSNTLGDHSKQLANLADALKRMEIKFEKTNNQISH